MGLVRVSGTWRDAEPYVRVNNVWRLCESEHVRVGGAWRETWRASVFTEGYMSGSGSYLEFGTSYDGHPSILAYAYSTSQNEYVATMVTREMIDLTNVNQISFRYTLPESGSNQAGVQFNLSTSQMGDHNDYDASSYILTNASFNRTYNMNVQHLTGSYYIRVHSIGRYYQGYRPMQVYLHEIQLDGVTFFDGTN